MDILVVLYRTVCLCWCETFEKVASLLKTLGCFSSGRWMVYRLLRCAQESETKRKKTDGRWQTDVTVLKMRTESQSRYFQ
jgi:hypothetical protein